MFRYVPTNDSKKASQYELAWNLFTEGRKEILEYQRIRAQIIGFKITFVSAAIAVMGANSEKIPLILLTVPAYAAIFFDFLIASYTFNIRRVGYYCKEYLEPVFRAQANISEQFVLWEEFMSMPGSQNRFTVVGNIGLTILSLIPAIIVLFLSFNLKTSIALLIPLLMLAAYDIYASILPNVFRRTRI